MQRKDLRPGLAVALYLGFGWPTPGTPHVQKVVVVDGPFGRNVQTRQIEKGTGSFWLVRVEDENAGEDNGTERYVESRKLLAPWDEHVAEQERAREERDSALREAEAERQRIIDWGDRVAMALNVIGVEWVPTSAHVTGDRVSVPVSVMDELVEHLEALR